MVKRSAKYFLILFVNLACLTGLLATWTDDLELIFRDWIRPLEFLKILGVNILSLVVISILISFTSKRNIKSTAKVKLSIVFTVLISLFLYVPYCVKIVNNKIIDRQLRDKIA